MRMQYLHHLPADWKPIAQIFAALGDSTRQTILLLFEPGERLSIKTIVDLLPLSRTAVVHHLKVLEDAGLISPEKQGRDVYYHVELETALEALDRVRAYVQDDLRLLAESRASAGPTTAKEGERP